MGLGHHVFRFNVLSLTALQSILCLDLRPLWNETNIMLYITMHSYSCINPTVHEMLIPLNHIFYIK